MHMYMRDSGAFNTSSTIFDHENTTEIELSNPSISSTRHRQRLERRKTSFLRDVTDLCVFYKDSSM